MACKKIKDLNCQNCIYSLFYQDKKLLSCHFSNDPVKWKEPIQPSDFCGDGHWITESEEGDINLLDRPDSIELFSLEKSGVMLSGIQIHHSGDEDDETVDMVEGDVFDYIDDQFSIVNKKLDTINSLLSVVHDEIEK
jgi:hypothetical protein